jgi:integrase
VTVSEPRRANGEARPFFNETRRRWELFVELPPGPDGKRRRKKVSGPTEPACRRAARKVRTAVDTGQATTDTRLTVGGWLDGWMRDVLPGTVKARTVEIYGSIVRRQLIPRLGRIRLSQLDASAVAAMMRGMEADGLSASSVTMARRVLRRSLRHAEQRRLVTYNAASLVDGPALKRSETRALSPDAARTIIEAAHGNREEAAFVLLIATGIRRGELLGLCWNDVDLEAGTAVFKHQVQRLTGRGLVLEPLKTDKSRRALALPEPVVALLRARRREQSADRLALGPEWSTFAAEHGGLVFTTALGGPVDPNNFYRRFRTLAERAGLGHVWPHQARHGVASMLFDSGLSMKAVSEQLGHANQSVTEQVYVHYTERARRATADAIGAALFAH